MSGRNINQMTFWPGFQVTVEEHGEWVESGMTELSPDWRFVDDQGHGHFVAEIGKKDRLPTLTKVIDLCSFEDHGADCQGQYHYECKLCNQRVVPVRRMAGPTYIPGAPSYTLELFESNQSSLIRTRYGFGPLVAEKLHDKFVAVVHEVLKDHVIEVIAEGR